MNLNKSTVVFGLLAFSVFGCNGDAPTATDKVATLMNMLDASTGHTFIDENPNTINTQSSTLVGRYCVLQDHNTGQYFAYNLDKLDQATMTTFAQYLAAANGPNDIISGISAIVHDDGQGGYYTTYSNGTFSFEKKRGNLKDLEKLAANATKIDTQIIQKVLTAQYGFSEERASKIAVLSREMKEIAGTRELTDADKDLFSQTALGLDYASLKKSVKKSDEGDASSFNQMLENAAALNGTTPEQARALIETLASQNQ